MASAAAKRYKELKNKQAAINKALEKTGKTALKEMVVEFFAEHPDLLSFSWTQYTPYWNDGDVCVFSAATDYPAVTFKAKDGKVLTFDENFAGYVDEEGEEIDVLPSKIHTVEGVYDENTKFEETKDPYEKQVNSLVKAVTNFLKPFDDDDLLTMFGDHQKVTVKRNGKIETEDYEHE